MSSPFLYPSGAPRCPWSKVLTPKGSFRSLARYSPCHLLHRVSHTHLSHRPPPGLQPDEFSKFSAGCNLCTSCSLIWLCDRNKILLCDQIKPLLPSEAQQALCDLPPPSAQNPPLSLRVSNSCIEFPCLGLSANMPNLK